MATPKNTPAPKNDDTATATEAKRTVIRYKHADGDVVDVDPNRLSDVIVLEREVGRAFNGQSTEDQMRLAYQKAGHPYGTGDDAFLDWVDGLDDAEQVEVDRPTQRRRQN